MGIQTSSDALIPFGCSRNTVTNQFHLNSHTGGAANGNYNLVCVDLNTAPQHTIESTSCIPYLSPSPPPSPPPPSPPPPQLPPPPAPPSPPVPLPPPDPPAPPATRTETNAGVIIAIVLGLLALCVACLSLGYRQYVIVPRRKRAGPKYKMSKKEQEYWELFDLSDKDNTGILEVDELRRLLAWLRENVRATAHAPPRCGRHARASVLARTCKATARAPLRVASRGASRGVA